MKLRIYTLLLVVFATVSTAMAYDFMERGLAYNINSDGETVYVTYTGPENPSKYITLDEANKYTYNYGDWGSDLRDVIIPEMVTHDGKTYKVTAIGSGAFCYCSNITGELSVGEYVKTIGAHAFKYCTGMRGNLCFPSGLEAINAYAFYHAGFNGVLDFCDQIINIGNYAFTECKVSGNIELDDHDIGIRSFQGTNISRVYVMSGLKKIPDYCFKDCKKLYLVDIYKGSSLNTIGYMAFSGCTRLSSIECPNDLTTLDNYAFSESSLSTFVANSKLTKIAHGTFYDCQYLKTVELPEVTTIADKAFYNCNSLSSITMDKVTSIGEEAFSKCRFYSVNMPKVQTIADKAFMGSSLLNSVKMASVKTIGDRAFMDTSVEDIALGSSITSIGYDAFSGHRIKKISINARTPPTINVSSFPNYDGVEVTGSYVSNYKTANVWSRFFNTFGGSDKLVYRVNGSDATLTYDNYATENNYKDLPSGYEIVIPEQVTLNGKQYRVTAVDDYAFYKAKNLKYIYLPNTVTKIGKYAFRYCGNMSFFAFANDPIANMTVGEYAFADCGLTVMPEIPERLTALPNGMFAGDSAMGGEIVIPGHITKMGVFVFRDCPISKATWNATAITTIPGGTFSGCTKLATFNCPSYITGIDYEAFYGCESLKKFTLPSRLTSIGDKAFAYSGFSGDLSLPSTLNTMGVGAFMNCKGITSLYIPMTIKKINSYTFSGCENLSGTLRLPGSITSIGDNAFMGTGFTGRLTIPASVTSIGSEAFRGCNGFTGDLELLSNVTRVDSCAFKGCKGLSALYIETAAAMPHGIFAECTGLKSVTNVTTTPSEMSETAFSNYNIPLFVTEGKVDSFKNSDWKLFNRILVEGSGLPGDVNNDDEIDVTDANILINIVLGKDSAAYYGDAADADGNGIIDVSDINFILNAILGK